MDTIFDLPAHPLMVHFPVVAIPVLAILGLVMAARPRFREHYSLPVIALAVVTVIATFMAARSGQALVDSIGISDERIDPHRDLGNMLRFFVLGLAIAIGAMIGVNKRSSATGSDPAALVAAALVVVFSLLSLVWTVRTGHEGAKSVWEGVVAVDEDDSEDAADVETTAPAPDSADEAVSDTEPLPEATTDAPATTEAPTSTEAGAADDADATAGEETMEDGVVAVSGQDVFESNCSRCHGVDGGGGRGPSLQGITVEQPDPSAAITQTTDGGNGMPAFGARLDEAEIVAAIDYIYATF